MMTSPIFHLSAYRMAPTISGGASAPWTRTGSRITLAAKRVMTDGMAYVQDKRLDLDHLQQRLGDVTGAVLGRHRQKFAALAASLDAMSPLAVLGRGYAVARDEQGKILKSWRETAPGSRVSVTLGEGGFTAVVDKPYTKEEQP